jgi:peptidoglycan/LPS O-acetylase OafA/YrhL
MTRYPWLDGLRGLAALYVLLHHAALEVNTRDLPIRVVDATGWLAHGHLAVAVFIVLSGFSLMLPVGRDGGIGGGLRGYFARRSRRILPAYYASLASCLLLIAVAPALRVPNGNERWDVALPAFEARSIVAHLLLIHDLDRDWIFKIDPPMWSVAVEWQVYFLFPVLVFAWRRAGHSASLVLALSATYSARSWMGDALSRLACPWYVALFAIGMLAASPKGSPARICPRRSGVLWLIAAMLAFDLGFGSTLVRADLLVGMATAAILWALVRSDRGAACRGLGSRPFVFLGEISYSLYLIHFPLLSLVSNIMLARGVGSGARLAVLMFVAAPIILAVSYMFHRAFEKPFLAGPRREFVVDGTMSDGRSVKPGDRPSIIIPSIMQDSITASGRPVAGPWAGRSSSSRGTTRRPRTGGSG